LNIKILIVSGLIATMSWVPSL